MIELFILSAIGVFLLCFALGCIAAMVKTRFGLAVVVPTIAVAGGLLFFMIASNTCGFELLNDERNFPWSTYIQDGTTLVEGDAVIDKLPTKFQEAVGRLRYGQNAYSIREASVKNKLKGDGIQQDHTVVWLERPGEEGYPTFKRRYLFVGVSHDIIAKVEHPLKVELSEDALKEILNRFPSELRDPVMSTYTAGGYKAYGLGPVTYYMMGSMSEVCAIQLIKEKLLPIDIANQRQRYAVDEVDVFIEDRMITTSPRP